MHDHTLLEDVKLLTPSSTLTYQDQYLLIQPYWVLKYVDTYQKASENEYIEQLLYYLRRAAANQTHDDLPSGLLLSGGLNSRVLLGLLMGTPVAKQLHAFTWGIPGCDDARFARKAALTAGAKHHFFELKPDWLLDKSQDLVRITDGLGNIVNLHAYATLEEETQFAKVIYKGFMGDALMGYAIHPMFWADYDDETRYRVHWQVHEELGIIFYSDQEKQAFLTPEFRQAVGDSVNKNYRNAIDQSHSKQLANQRLFFDLRQRVPHMTLKGVEVVRDRAAVRLPFCDKDLVDFMTTVPPGYNLGRRLMLDAFTRNFTALAKVPATPANLPMISCAQDVQLRANRFIKWHLRNAGLGWLAGPEVRPYKNYHGWFRTILRSWLEDTLFNSNALNRGYFEPEYIQKLVKEHMDGANHTVRLGALLTLELWHQRYID